MFATIKKYFFTIFLSFQLLHSSAKDYPASLFGIYSDGVTLNTRSIQFAIDYINQQGGGRLVFDVGRFLTGTIHMKSNVTIHLLEGAVLLGSLNPFDYDREGMTALILSRDQKNIGITGKGVIDGQGRYVARNVIELVHKGLIKDLFRNDRPEVEIRPMLIYFRSCENISMKGITMKNAAAWVQTYDQCKNLRIDSMTVDSRAFWNNDGIDIVDCDFVSIANTYIDAADDGICLKSHDDKAVCQRVLIWNCTIRSSANGIKFGTASRGGFSNIKLINIKVFNTYRSAIALEAVDGGFLESVEVDSLNISNTGNAIFMRIGERVPGKKGRLEYIHVDHVWGTISGSKPDSGYEYEGPIEDMPRNISPAIIITGQPDAMIKNITLNNIDIIHPGGGDSMFTKVTIRDLDSVPEKPAAYPEFSMFRELPAWGIYVRHAQDVHMSNIKLTSLKKDYRYPVLIDDVHNSQLLINNARKYLYQYRSSGISLK